jgi:hypothetical protein
MIQGNPVSQAGRGRCEAGRGRTAGRPEGTGPLRGRKGQDRWEAGRDGAAARPEGQDLRGLNPLAAPAGLANPTT